jgi:hypothetical protein
MHLSGEMVDTIAGYLTLFILFFVPMVAAAGQANQYPFRSHLASQRTPGESRRAAPRAGRRIRAAAHTLTGGDRWLS